MNYIRKFSILIITLFFCAGCHCPLSKTKCFKQEKKIEVNIPYKKIVLNNGLTAIIHNDNSLPNVSLHAFIKAGVLTEDKLVSSGVSHLVEHMLFESSSSHANTGIAKEIRSAGGEINAYTSLDKTVYYIDMIGNNYEKGLKVLYNALFKSTFNQTAFDNEKQIILKEINYSLDSPNTRTVRKLFNKIFDNNHPYAFPVIGFKDNFKKLSLKQAFSYYKKMYIPENIILVISGNINKKNVENKVKQLFENEKRNIPYTYKNYQKIYKHLNFSTELSEKDTTISQLYQGYRTKGVDSEHDLILDIIAVMLGSGKNSILYRDLKYKHNIVYNVEANNYSLKNAGVFLISSLFEYKNKENLTKTISNQINKIKNGNFSLTDLKNAKNKIKSNYIFSQESLSGRANILGTYEFYFSQPKYYKDYLKKLKKITKKDIVDTARKLFEDRNSVRFIVKPKRKVISNQSSVISRENKGMDYPDKPGNDEVSHHKFNSGMNLILCKRKNGPPVISIKLLMAGGVLFEGTKYNGISNLLSKLLLKGTNKMTAQEISAFIENKGGSISSFSGNNSIGIEIDMLSSYLDESLDLLKNIIFKSSFPEKEISIEKKDIQALLKEEKQDGFSIGFNNLKKLYFQNHPYSLNAKGDEKKIVKITRKNILDFYNKILAPSNITIAVFGDIDKNNVKKLIKSKFESYFKNKKYNKFTYPKINIKHSKEKEIIGKTPKKQSVIMFGLPTSDAFSDDRYKLNVLNNMLSGISGIIYNEIRTKQGLAYSTGSTYITGFNPGVFVFYALTEKKQTDNIKDTFYDIIKKIKTGNFTESDLENSKKNILGNYNKNIETNSSFSFDVILDNLYNTQYRDYLKFHTSKIKSITKKDIIDIANKYFDESKLKISIVNPEEE